jgi:hypothetical protein
MAAKTFILMVVSWIERVWASFHGRHVRQQIENLFLVIRQLSSARMQSIRAKIRCVVFMVVSPLLVFLFP